MSQQFPLGKNAKALLFAAGLGTRLKPFTNHHPKALALVNNKTLLQRNIEYLQQYGITNVIVNVHHFSNQIINIIKENKGWGSNVSISDETDEVLETGGGLKKASWFFEDVTDFVVMNVDILTNFPLNEMMNEHKQINALATLAVTNRTTSRYLLFDENNRLCGWRNKITGEEKISISSNNLLEKAFSGIHIIKKEMLKKIKQQGKFSMIDVYLSLAAENKIKCYDHSSFSLIDVGKVESILIAEKMFK